jgi:hypothetical protein
MRKIFCSAAIVIALVPCSNLLQASQQDTTTQEIRRSYIALGAGVNLWTEGGVTFDGTAAISTIIPVSGPWWFQLEVGAWEVQRRWPLAGRIGIAMRYDIWLTDKFSPIDRRSGTKGQGVNSGMRFHSHRLDEVHLRHCRRRDVVHDPIYRHN